MRASRVAALGLAGLLVSACEDPWEDDYDDVWAGEKVTVYSYGMGAPELARHSSSLDLLGVHTASVMAFLGVEGDAGPFTYRWMSPALVEEHCPTTACTRDGVVMSARLPDMHEASHMVMASSIGLCPRLLEEGVATYLDGPSVRGGDLGREPEFQIDALLDYRRWQLHPRAYARAGHFVAFLAERHGGEAIARLCAELPRAAGWLEWERVVPVVLGRSLTELLTEYRSYPECGADQYRGRLWECGGEADWVFDGDHREWEIEWDGDEDRVITMRSDPRELVLSRRVRFVEDSSVIVEVFVDGARVETAAFYASQECGPCSEAPQVFDQEVIEGWDPLDRSLEYRAGVHEVIVKLDERVGDSLLLRITVVG